MIFLTFLMINVTSNYFTDDPKLYSESKHSEFQHVAEAFN